MTKYVTLAECPPGLFRFGETLGFKTKYDDKWFTLHDARGDQPHITEIRWPNAYCVDTGEYFWGGAKMHEDRSLLMVEPIERNALASFQMRLIRSAYNVPNISMAERAVLVCLASLSDRNAEACAAIPTIMEFTAASERTVQRAIRRLCSLGHIDQRQRRWRSAEYTIHLEVNA